MARREFEIPEFALPRTGFTTGILRAQDDRQLPRLPDEGQVDRDVRLAQRHHEEKPQRRQGVVDGWHAGAARDQMQLIAAHASKRAVPGEAPRNALELLTARM